MGSARTTRRPGTPLLEMMRQSIDRGMHTGKATAEKFFADFIKRVTVDREPVVHRRLTSGRLLAVRHEPMENGGWVGTYEDITERERAAEELKEQHRPLACRFRPSLRRRDEGHRGDARGDCGYLRWSSPAQPGAPFAPTWCAFSRWEETMPRRCTSRASSSSVAASTATSTSTRCTLVANLELLLLRTKGRAVAAGRQHASISLSGSLCSRIRANSVQVSGDFIMSAALRPGLVRLSRAQISGRLDCDGGCFEGRKPSSEGSPPEASGNETVDDAAQKDRRGGERKKEEENGEAMRLRGRRDRLPGTLRSGLPRRRSGLARGNDGGISRLFRRQP